MSNPIRLDPKLIAAAQRESLVQKRSVPKQIEFWATLGKTLQNVLDYSDIIAVLQGMKKVTIESVKSSTVDPEAVFAGLEKQRQNNELSQKVTAAAVYYEASRNRPGLIDRVNAVTGERQTGQFYDGEFKAGG